MSLRVTGVGSLPHRDPGEAARFVLDTTDVPYLPQLPHRHPAESMLAQWGDGLAGCGAGPDGLGLRHGAPVGDRREAFGGAAALLDTLPRLTPLVKTQATGPVTLAMAALAGGAPAVGLWDAVVTGLVARVAEHLAWIGQRLPAADVLLVLDEPALAGLSQPDFPAGWREAKRALEQTMAALPVRPGIHCCGEADWALVAALRPASISWDVAGLGPDFPASAPAMARAVAGGTGIMWGVAPATPPPLPDAAELVDRYRRVEGELLVAGAPAGRLAARPLLTPACGLAGLTIDQAAAVADRARTVGGEVRVGG